MNSLPLQLRSLMNTAPSEAMDNPRREILMGGALIGTLALGLLASTTLIHMDAAMHSSGVIRVDGNRQTVQSALGGTVSAIRVREGASVKAGQLLFELATPEVMAQERSYASRVFGLQAEIARIETELAGGATIPVPDEWRALSSSDRIDAERALATEQLNLRAQRDLLESQRLVLRQQETQAKDQIGGYRQKRAANIKEDSYTEEELRLTQGLFEKGYATKQRVLALQRSSASSAGERGSINAEIARLDSSAAQARLQILQVSDQHRQEITDRLRAARTELQSTLPQWRGARKQLDEATVRAPVAGTVLGLSANTLGGVIPAGGKLMDIVPTEKRLVIEAAIPPGEIGDLRVGQTAKVRISAAGHMMPELTGTLSRIAPDAVTDEKSGHSFYNAVVSISQTEIAKLATDQSWSAIRPGTPVAVTVPLKKRTLFQFMVGPLTERFSSAMSER